MSHSRSHSVASSSSLEIIDDEELRNVMEEERQVFLQDSTNQRQVFLQDSTNQRRESLQDPTNHRQVSFQDSTNQRQESLQDPTNQRQVSLQDPTNHNSIEEIVEGLENAAKGITVSNVNPQQVVFEDVKDTYTDTIQVRVVSKGDVLDVGDVVGVFRTPFLDIKECLTASQIIIDQDNKLKGSVKLTRLDDLTEKEFYQFQYLRQAKNAKDGEILHTICGASVPWQFVKSMTEHAVEPEGSVATWDMYFWDMEKYNQIEIQIWSPDSSRLTEMCIAEQIKEFITPLDPAIQVRFISHLLNQVKSDPALYKSCSVYNKIYRIFHLMANMELNCIVDQAPVKNLDQLLQKMLEKIRH